MKAWAYVAIIIAVIAAIGGVYKAGHSSGYNKRDQQVQQDIIEAQRQAQDEAEQRWSASVVAATKAIKVETRIVEKIREVEIEVPKIIETIVEHKPECSDLGYTYAGLLNDQVRASNGVQAAASPAPPDG